MKANFTVLLFFILYFLGACNLGDNEITQIITDIDDEFSIDLYEKLDEEERSFVLQFASIDEKECKNYIIDIEHELDENEDFNVYINDIVLPDNTSCEAGRSIATSQINLGTLNLGIYDIEISLRDAIFNKGELKVSHTDYTLSLYTAHGVKILHNKLLRVPAQSIWGYVGYSGSVNDIAKLDEFTAGLQEFTSNIDLATGYYGHFEWNGQVSFPESTGTTVFKSFIFDHQRNIQEIEEYVDLFRLVNRNEPNLKVQLFTAEGHIF